MDDDQFRCFLELMMVSDPWPLQWGHEIMNNLADDQARARGYSDWIAAYHEMGPVNNLVAARIPEKRP